MSESFEIFEDVSNPLDSVEDILQGNEMVFSRPNPDELTVQISGEQSSYKITFLWQEEYSAMQFFCELDIFIPQERRDLMARAMRTINEKLWLGHFDCPDHTSTPCFRHTSLFRGWTHTSGAEHVEDLIDIAIAECERHSAVFSMLASPLPLEDALLSLALTDGAGKA